MTEENRFDAAATAWDEGLPLGNGDLGCRILGTADRLRFSLDKGDLWDLSKTPEDDPLFRYAVRTHEKTPVVRIEKRNDR